MRSGAWDCQLMDEEEGEREAAVGRVEKLFQRQLAVPLLHMEDTWQEYEEFRDEHGLSVASFPSSYCQKKAMWGAAAERGGDEVRAGTGPGGLGVPGAGGGGGGGRDGAQVRPLQGLHRPRGALPCSAWNDLPELRKGVVKVESVGEKDPWRVVSIFERALIPNCLNHKLWVRYLHWLDANLKAPNVILPIYEVPRPLSTLFLILLLSDWELKRATRNVPWSPDVWSRYLAAVERAGRPLEELQGLFEVPFPPLEGREEGRRAFEEGEGGGDDGGSGDGRGALASLHLRLSPSRSYRLANIRSPSFHPGIQQHSILMVSRALSKRALPAGAVVRGRRVGSRRRIPVPPPSLAACRA